MCTRVQHIFANLQKIRPSTHVRGVLRRACVAFLAFLLIFLFFNGLTWNEHPTQSPLSLTRFFTSTDGLAKTSRRTTTALSELDPFIAKTSPASELQLALALQENIEDRVITLLTPIVGRGRVVAKAHVLLDFNQQVLQRDLSLLGISDTLCTDANNCAMPLLGIPENVRSSPRLGGQMQRRSNITPPTTATAGKTDALAIAGSSVAVTRLTLAVIIDGNYAQDAAGNSVFMLKPEAELTALRQLVAHTVGLDPTRGDTLQLNCIPFTTLSLTDRDAVLMPPLVLLLDPFIKTVLALLVMWFILRPLILAFMRPKNCAESAPVSPATEVQSSLPAVAHSPPPKAEEVASTSNLEALRQTTMQLFAAHKEQSFTLLYNWLDTTTATLGSATDLAQVDGLQKAAILLLSMGDSFTREVFQNLEREYITRLSQAIATMDVVPDGIVSAVLQEFHHSLAAGQIPVRGGQGILKRILTKNADKETAQSVLQSLHIEQGTAPFHELSQVNSHILSQVLRSEHPQTLALVMGHMDPKKAASLLSLLPATMRSNILFRLAKLEAVPEEVVLAVDKGLQHQMLAMGEGKGGGKTVGGLQAVADILNAVDWDTGEEILATIGKKSSQMADDLRHCMLTFEDLQKLHEDILCEALSDIPTSMISAALYGATNATQQKLLACLDQEQAKLVGEKLARQAPILLETVESAQNLIITAARLLQKKLTE